MRRNNQLKLKETDHSVSFFVAKIAVLTSYIYFFNHFRPPQNGGQILLKLKIEQNFKSFRRFGERILNRVFRLLPEAVDAYCELGDKRRNMLKSSDKNYSPGAWFVSIVTICLRVEGLPISSFAPPRRMDSLPDVHSGLPSQLGLPVFAKATR